MERLLLTSNRDPRKDSRVAEMVRIGAGVGAWKKIRVDLFFRGRAALALDEFPDELADGNLLQEYLAGIQNHGGQIYVDAGNAFVKKIQSACKFKELSDSEFRKLLRETRYCINL